MKNDRVTFLFVQFHGYDEILYDLNLIASLIFFRYQSDVVISKPSPLPLVAAYDFAQEICEPEQLDELLADPDEMRMQALVIRERILGPAHPDTSYYIRYRGAVYADAGKFDRCIQLWNYALDMQQGMLEPLNPMTQSSFFSFAELFSFMIGEEGRQTSRGRRVPPVDRQEILKIFLKAVSISGEIFIFIYFLKSSFFIILICVFYTFSFSSSHPFPLSLHIYYFFFLSIFLYPPN